MTNKLAELWLAVAGGRQMLRALKLGGGMAARQ